MSPVNPLVCPACALPFDPAAAGGPCPRCALAGALSDAADLTTASSVGRLAHFDLVDELGRGAMGRVWLARDTQLDRLVALKTLPSSPDASLRARLEREARIAAALHHPHIIAVHGLGQSGDTIWVAMELADGGDLRARLRDRPLPVAEAAAYAEKLAGALAYAHAAGVLHRDLKPSNILLDAAGEPRLADFGLAGPHQGGDLTLTGQVLGTPSYLAPETLRPASTRDPAQAHLSDVYSLGAVLYEMLAGRPPFVGDTAAVILLAVSTQEPVPLSRLRAKIPRDLETIALKCLEKDPARRYANATHLAADLAAFRQGRPIAGRPVSTAGRLWRWGRREPHLAFAAAAIALLLVAVAAISTTAAIRVSHAEARASAEAAHAIRAEAATREQLRSALLAQARANRGSGAMGQRFDTLQTLQQAAAIRPGADLRQEAILTLTLPDLRQTQRLAVQTESRRHLAFDEWRPRFAIETQPGTWEIRARDGGKVLLRLSTQAGAALSRPVFSRDGRYLVARSATGHVLVWDLAVGGEPCLDLPGRRYALAKTGMHDYGAPDAFSPDGQLLASADDESGFTLVELPSGREIGRVPTRDRVTHLSFSPDGQTLLVGRGLRGNNGEPTAFLLLAPVAHPSNLRELPTGDFQSVEWSSDGTRLFRGSLAWDVLDVATGQVITTVRDDATSGFLTPDGRFALTIRKTGIVKLWDLKTGESLLRGILNGGVELGISADRRKIYCESGPGHIAEFTLESPTVETTWPAVSATWDNASRQGTTLAYSPDGRRLVDSVWGHVHLRDAATGRVLDTRDIGNESEFTSALFTPDGQAVFVSGEGSALQRIALVDGQRFGGSETIDPELGYVASDLNPDGKRLLLLNPRAAPVVKVITLDGSAPPVRWAFPKPTRGMFLPEGKQVLVNGYSQVGKLPVELFDAQTGQVTKAVGMKQGYELSWNRDRRWVVLGTNYKESGLWRTDTWQRGPALPIEAQGAGKATAFSPDGSVLAVASGHEIWLIRVADGVALAQLTLDRTDNFAPDLHFSPDGTQLAVLWHLGQLTLWNLPVLHRELAQLGLDW